MTQHYKTALIIGLASGYTFLVGLVLALSPDATVRVDDFGVYLIIGLAALTGLIAAPERTPNADTPQATTVRRILGCDQSLTWQQQLALAVAGFAFGGLAAVVVRLLT